MFDTKNDIGGFSGGFSEPSLLVWLTNLEEQKKAIVDKLLGIERRAIEINGSPQTVPVTVSKPLLTKDEVDKIMPLFEAATSRITLFSSLDSTKLGKIVKETLLLIYEKLLDIQLEREMYEKEIKIYRIDEEKLKTAKSLEDVIIIDREKAPSLLSTDIEMCFNVFLYPIMSVYSRAKNGEEINRWKEPARSFGFDEDFFGKEQKKEEGKKDNILDILNKD
jgi:hypothetical protein